MGGINIEVTAVCSKRFIKVSGSCFSRSVVMTNWAPFKVAPNSSIMDALKFKLVKERKRSSSRSRKAPSQIFQAMMQTWL